MLNLCLLLLCSLTAFQYSDAGTTEDIPSAFLDRSVDPLTVRESDGFAEVCVMFSRILSMNASVVVRAQTGTGAQPNVDYVPLEETVTFFAFSNELRKCVNITILDDNIEEGEDRETVNVQLVTTAPPTPNIIVDFDILLLEIIDSDTLVLKFTQPVYEITEGGSQLVCVQTVNGTLANGVDLRVGIRFETSGEFSLNTTSLQISSDPDRLSCAEVTIAEDTLIEPLESFDLTLARDGLEVSFAQGMATVTIQDNDGATLRLDVTEFEIMEGRTGQFTLQQVCVILSNDEGGLDRDIVINITTATDNATSDIDFVAVDTDVTVLSGSLIMSDPPDIRHCIEFSIIGDDQREPNETFSILFIPAISRDQFEGDSIVTVTIVDDNDLLDCRTLMNPDDGVVNLLGNDFGDMATYTCNNNFVLEPAESATRTCMANDWSGVDPICVARCSPLSIEDGQISGNSLSAGENTVVNYTCNINFMLRGNERRVCGADGVWTGSDPECIALLCPPLDNPDDGGVTILGERMVDSVATYSCARGFRLIDGSEMRVCGEDQVWSGEEPLCSGTAGGTAGVMNVQSMLTSFTAVLLALLAVSSL